MTSDMSAAIQAVWERSRGVIARRLSTLEQAAAAVLDGGGDELRKRAHSDAHKLAGSLGMFGLARGSELAREVEHALKGGASLNDARVAELVVALRDEIDAHTPGRCGGETGAGRFPPLGLQTTHESTDRHW